MLTKQITYKISFKDLTNKLRSLPTVGSYEYEIKGNPFGLLRHFERKLNRVLYTKIYQSRRKPITINDYVMYVHKVN